jgi:hypothetical protein
MAKKHLTQHMWLIEVVTGPLSDECIIWPFKLDKDGYGRFRFNKKNRIANRESLILHCGGPPNSGLHAAHECHNPSCINPLHLHWATPAQNIQEKVNLGRQAAGVSHGRVKLTKEQVIEIFKSSLSNRKLALIYGVSHGAVNFIKTGRTWSHTTGQAFTCR